MVTGLDRACVMARNHRDGAWLVALASIRTGGGGLARARRPVLKAAAHRQ
jgi:hypothetical protein